MVLYYQPNKQALRNRDWRELVGSTENASEFRILGLDMYPKVEEGLKLMKVLGRLGIEKQKFQDGKPYSPALKKIWDDTTTEADALFKEYGLPSALDMWSVGELEKLNSTLDGKDSQAFVDKMNDILRKAETKLTENKNTGLAVPEKKEEPPAEIMDRVIGRYLGLLNSFLDHNDPDTKARFQMARRAAVAAFLGMSTMSFSAPQSLPMLGGFIGAVSLLFYPELIKKSKDLAKNILKHGPQINLNEIKYDLLPLRIGAGYANVVNLIYALVQTPALIGQYNPEGLEKLIVQLVPPLLVHIGAIVTGKMLSSRMPIEDYTFYEEN